MEIRTITCHNCYNYGAVLQTFALQHYCENNYGNCAVINYIPRYMEYRSRYRYIPPKWNVSVFRRVIWCAYHHPKIMKYKNRKKAFDRFISKYIPMTDKYKTYDDLLQNPPAGDVFICGSDQIWNGIDYYNGRDSAFYLGFVQNKKKIAYAASFGRDYVDKNIFDEKLKLLSDFSGISVREETGKKILKDYGIDGTVVIDPVFLLDTNDWLTLANSSELKGTLQKTRPYILVYILGNNSKAIEMVRPYIQDYDIVVIGEIGLGGIETKHDKNAGPLEFLQYINSSSYIITNSFHCVAFSIIFKKRFAVYNREGINGRIDNLLTISQIGQKTIDNDINKEIDYNEIHQNLKQYIDLSKEYLRRAVLE